MTRREDESLEDFTGAAEELLRHLRSTVGLESWFVTRRTGDEQVILSALDPVLNIQPGATLPWESTYCARMLDGSAPMAAPVVDEVPAYVAARELNEIPAASYLSVPIVGPTGDVLGTVCGFDRDIAPGLTGHLPTVRLHARMLGTLLSHELQLIDARRGGHDDPAARDPLTGVGNRRAWDAAISAHERRAARFATEAGILVVDLDRLRDVNDAFGHEAGDQVLVRTATILRGLIGEADVAARIGGDEFGVILPDRGYEETLGLVRELREALRAAEVVAAIGFSQRRPETGLAGAWRTADAAMYEDKLSASGEESALRPPTSALNAVLTAPPSSDIDTLLRLAMAQLGMDGAFLSRFEGAQRTFRNVVAVAGDQNFVPPGYTDLHEGSFCQLITDGKVPEVTPDIRDNPLMKDNVMAGEADIGAYVGVPVYRSSGELYGTLCAFSHRPDPSLRERDAEVLRAVAGVAMDMVEAEDKANRRRQELVHRLDALYSSGGPRIVYQPIRSLTFGQVVGVEALSRFPKSTPEPEEWFADASAFGVGTDLELIAAQKALEGLGDVEGFLAINVSAATILSPGFARLMERIPPEQVVIEISERDAIDDYGPLLDVLRPMRADGLRVAVDDAGAGFSSMHHVLAIMPDFIKLDSSLIRAIDTDLARQAFAAALSAFAFKTGALVIAEGVETEEELRCLRALGVDCGQGFHLGHPVPAAAESGHFVTPP